LNYSEAPATDGKADDLAALASKLLAVQATLHMMRDGFG
jgi:hypothetical protein